MSDFYVEVYQGKKQGRQSWRWRAINAGNNRKLANSGEAYTNKADCEVAVRALFGVDVTMRWPGAETT